MTHLATIPPSRKADLVAWPAADQRRYLVRNRASGESFEIGAEEHFLLERLDGRQTRDAIGRDFCERFGQPLSAEELEEFVQLAAQCGLLGPSPATHFSRGAREEGTRGQLTQS